MSAVAFSVQGRPVPQGSKKAIRTSHGRTLLVESSGSRLAEWRAQVAHAATVATAHLEGPLEGPVSVGVRFVLARPKSHLRTNGEVRDSAPPCPATRPDIDKLARAVLDALTGPVLRDDGQVASFFAIKVYGWPERCEISVRELAAARVAQ